MNKNLFAAFVIGIVPGLGHLYLGRNWRAFLYACGFFGLILMLAASGGEAGVAVALLVVWVASVLDLFVTIMELRRVRRMIAGGASGGYAAGAQAGRPASDAVPSSVNPEGERFYTMVSSIIPGLGHFQIGLMQRGLSFLVSFFGLLAMIVFVSIITRFNGLLAFLLVLPIIWLYCLFDAIQLLHRKQAGETLQDRTIFGEFEESHAAGRKSKTLAMMLAVLPGAGHMYLGLQQRGLQLMAGFLFSFYVLDALRLSIFLFMIPILWFYSLFDAMQHVSKYGVEEVKDVPMFDWVKNHHKWVGFGLLALGVYYLFDRFVLIIIERLFPQAQIYEWFHQYFQVFVVAAILIAGGMRLLAGSRDKTNRSKEE